MNRKEFLMLGVALLVGGCSSPLEPDATSHLGKAAEITCKPSSVFITTGLMLPPGTLVYDGSRSIYYGEVRASQEDNDLLIVAPLAGLPVIDGFYATSFSIQRAQIASIRKLTPSETAARVASARNSPRLDTDQFLADFEWFTR